MHLGGDQLGAAALLRDHRSRRLTRGRPAPHKSGHAAARWVVVLRLRWTRPRRRRSLQRSYGLVLRDQRPRRPRLLPPLATRPKPRRHHHHRLEHRATSGHPLRRVSLPRRLHGRKDGRPETWHPLRSLGAHGSSDRGTATRVGGDRERPRVALRARDPRKPRRRRQ